MEGRGSQLIRAALFLLIALSTLPSSNCQENCRNITADDLGNTTFLSTDGLLSMVTEGQPFQLLRYNVVCLSSGSERDTYQFASVIVGYNCPGCTEVPELEIIDQITLQCISANTWSIVRVRTFPLEANFSTPLETACQSCVDPDFDPGPLELYNFATHCLGMLMY